MSLTKDDKTWVVGAIRETVSETVSELLNDVIMPQFDMIAEKFDEQDKRFDEHDRRFDRQDRRFDEILATLRRHDSELAAIREQVNNIDGRLEALENDVRDIYEMLTGIEKVDKSVRKVKRDVKAEILRINSQIKILAKETGVELPA